MSWHLSRRCPRCRWVFQCPVEQYNRMLCRACEKPVPPPVIEHRADG